MLLEVHFLIMRVLIPEDEKLMLGIMCISQQQIQRHLCWTFWS
jgi:hypothetical protein